MVPRPNLEAPPQRDEPLGPPQERGGVALLRLDVDRLVVVLGVHHHRQVELLGVGLGEAGVAVRAPLHGGAHAVAVAQVDVVPHADLVAVVEHRRAGQREEQRLEQLDGPPVVLPERREAAADAQVDAQRRRARTRYMKSRSSSVTISSVSSSWLRRNSAHWLLSGSAGSAPGCR
jgi:hypothetical protein